jgi:hypothetical protein
MFIYLYQKITTTKLIIMRKQETIQELEMDIQYLTDKVANGWYNGQDEKNNILAQREYLESKLIRINN